MERKMKHIILTIDGTRMSMLAAGTLDALIQAMELFPAAGRITAKVAA
jgi:hypothetical protein